MFSVMSTKMCSNVNGIVFLVIMCSFIPILRAEFQQQRAKIVYVNPKHIQFASIFTTRSSRSSPYSTNMNITTLSAWGNNVTIRITYSKLKAKSDALTIESKTCDMIKHKWVRDWVEKYSNMSIDSCPLKWGVYRFKEFELPPKNFPLLILTDKSSDYESTFLVYATNTKEHIMEISILLMFKSNTTMKRNRSSRGRL